MKINFLLILLTVFSFNLISKDLSGIKASRTILSMDSGEMEFLITKKEDNLWEMRSFVDGGRVFEREEISIFKLSKENLIPLNHKIRMRILFKKIKSSTSFDWENLKANYQEGKDKKSIPLIEGTLGPATAQLQMRLDLRRLDLNSLPEKIKYLIFFRGEIKQRTYLLEGFEDIKTPLGNFKALKLSREFAPDEEREQVYWFAPELDFAVVRILNKDRRQSDFLLKSLEIID